MKKRKGKVKVEGVLVLLLLVAAIIFLITKIGSDNTSNKVKEKEDSKLTINDFENIKLDLAKQYAKENNLDLDIKYSYSEVSKDYLVSGNIDGDKLSIIVSKGSVPIETFKEKGVNELGNVPIMMYHGIRNKTSNSTGTVGGNVDKDGYNRTPDAFRKDLESYYEKGYRMIRLEDYSNGIIDVPLGFSPIVLTFDDGNEDNFKVTGVDDSGNLIFDKNSAIGILEEFKSKHEDASVTATFFLTGALCNQKEYNERIIKWLVENGYDVGNHTKTHLDIKVSSKERVQAEIAYVYDELERIIPGKYVKSVALPFGSPYSKNHSNYQYVLNTNYNNKQYETKVALRVGWEPEVSPFNKVFDKTYLKRCRAYDNNGREFDISMVFNMLEKNRFISDGDKEIVTIPVSLKDKLNDLNKEIITY